MNIWNHRGSGSSSSDSSWMKCEVNKVSNTFWQVGLLWDSSLISWTPPSTMSHSYWIPIECLCIFGCSLKIWRYTILLSLLYHCQEQGYTFSVVFEKDNGSLLTFNLLLIAFSYGIENISLYLHDKCPLSTAVLIVAIGLLYTRIWLYTESVSGFK